MLAKVLNDFSPPIRKDSYRLSSCVNVCLHCVIANKHSVLSCRRSLTRPMTVPYSCAWLKLSPHSLLACAVQRKRLVLSFGITMTYLEGSQAAVASRFFSILARRVARSLRVKVH